MSKYFLGIFIAAIFFMRCGVSRQPADAGSNRSVTVLTYNIHHANPPSKPGFIDAAAVAAVIRQQQPSLVALQEIDVHTGRSGNTLHEAEAIAKQTGMQFYFARAIDYDGGEYGIALLSKYPIEKVVNYALPVTAGTGGEPRVLAMVLVKLPGMGKCWFAGTHLDAQKNDANRVAQINQIVALLKGAQWPVIIAGDLNAVPGSAVINTLDRHFTRTCLTGCGFTIPEINPRKTIDYIAFTPGAFTVAAHSVVDAPYASDHLPVKAVLQY